MWDFAAHLYPEAKITFREIQGAPLLQDVPYPVPPSISLAKQGRIVDYLQRVHQYMMTLSYNHTGTQFFETKPNRYVFTEKEEKGAGFVPFFLRFAILKNTNSYALAFALILIHDNF